MSSAKVDKQSRWFFGGMASGGAACFTHPLDLLKVTLQTQQDGKLSAVQLTGKIIRERGIFALYNGISASLLRQLTYSTTRFGLYEIGKNDFGTSFLGKVLLAGASGAAGGLVGTPADMVNVRMQNDVKLPPEQRRNYKNAIDGLLRVKREEGFRRLFAGATTATARGFLMTIGQIAFYDQAKTIYLGTGYFKDDPRLHFVSSLTAGAIATLLTQPIDVIKTRSMSAKPGEFSSLTALILHTAKLGPMGFFKGFIPAFVRLGPHTVITFILLEQLRLNFGRLPSIPHPVVQKL